MMKARPLCLCFLGLMLVICLMKAAGFPIYGEPENLEEIRRLAGQGRTVQLTGTVSEREQKSGSTQYLLKHSILNSQNHSIEIETLYLTVKTGEPLRIGAEVCAAGTLYMTEPARNPGQFDSYAYSAASGVFCRLYANHVTVQREGGGFFELLTSARETLTDRLVQLTGRQAGGVLSAMLFGVRDVLSEESKLNFQAGGMFHILVISGLHISMIGMGLFRLLLGLRLPQTPSAAVTVGFLILYCLFSGSSVSAVRAVVMFAAMLTARLLRRSYDLLCALSLSGILLLLDTPCLLFTCSFQLSFVSVIGVGVVSPFLRSLLPEQKRGRRSRIRKAARRLSEESLNWCGVLLCTAPLLCTYFYELPLWSLLFSLLLLPLTGWILGLGLSGSLVGLRLFLPAQMLLFLPARCLEGFEVCMEWLRAHTPFTWICGQPTPLQCGLFYAVLAGALLAGSLTSMRSRRRRGMLLIPVLLCFCLQFCRSVPDFSLTMLDVGQGDALVLREKNGGCWLVDGGSSDVDEVGTYRILPYLKQQGISVVNGIFLSHPDQDHTNGILELLELAAKHQTSLQIRRLFLPLWMKESEEAAELTDPAERAGIPIFYLQAGDRIRAGEMELCVLHPKADSGIREGNSGSLVLSLSYDSFTALLTGDLETEGEQELLPLPHAYTYLKVAHHGSRNATGEALLREARPKLCTISVPKKSRYGHPHAETLARIAEEGAACLTTAECGVITVTVERGEVKVFRFL